MSLTVSYIFSCKFIDSKCSYIISYNDVNNYVYTYLYFYKYIKWLHDKNLLLHDVSISVIHVTTNVTVNTSSINSYEVFNMMALE